MYTPDPASIAGTTLDVAETAQLLVIGGGPAGLAAATEAAAQGLKVVLVDEHPIPAETMGEDVPQMFGARMGGAARNRNAMLEAVVEADPAIAAAFEAGVDVRLGTVAWGLYDNGPSVGWLPGPVAALSDGERSWLIGIERAIVAAGRRDMGLAFPGWDFSGVMGMSAASLLARRYGALQAERAVVLGSTAEALAATLDLQRAGVDVVAVLEQAPEPVGPAHLVAAVTEAGVPLLCGCVVQRAEGGPDSVVAVVSVGIDPDGRHRLGSERRFATRLCSASAPCRRSSSWKPRAAAWRSAPSGAAMCPSSTRRAPAHPRVFSRSGTAPASGPKRAWIRRSRGPRGDAPPGRSRLRSAARRRRRRRHRRFRSRPMISKPIGSAGSGPAWSRPRASPMSAAARR
jgi:hypothetical protein